MYKRQVILNADDRYHSELEARAAELPRLAYGIRAAAAGVRAVNVARTETCLLYTSRCV